MNKNTQNENKNEVVPFCNRKRFGEFSIQIDKDERSYTMQIKTRKNNFEENKKNINSIITSIISNSELSDDLLDIDDDDPMLE